MHTCTASSYEDSSSCFKGHLFMLCVEAYWLKVEGKEKEVDVVFLEQALLRDLVEELGLVKELREVLRPDRELLRCSPALPGNSFQ